MSVGTLTATFVVPTRNEEQNINSFLTRLHQALSGEAARVLVVDDSDDPRTVAEVLRVNRHLPDTLDACYLHRAGPTRQGGLAGAVIDGLNLAGSEYVVVMDADLQHPPETVPELLEALKNGADIAIASRHCAGGSSGGLSSPVRHLVLRASTWAAKLLFPWVLRGVSDPMSGYFAVRRGALDLHSLRPRGFKILLEVLVRHPGMNRVEVPLQFAARQAGESKGDLKQGLEYLKHLIRLRLGTIPRFVNFAFGGGSIALIGVAMLWVMVRAGFAPVAANAAQLAMTMGFNYCYNHAVTWRRQSSRSLRAQVWRFVLTRGGAQCLSGLAFAALVNAGLPYLVATTLCLAITTVLNYLTSKYLVFGRLVPPTG